MKVDEREWTAEIRIPFSQIRFPSGGRHVWGINVVRYLRRNNESDWLALVPKRETRLASGMGELAGLDNVHPIPRTEIMPHAVVRESADVKTSATAGPWVGTLGIDMRQGLGTNLTLDATVNPDFAQVEGDPAVINLTGFETFLDERRPFFTESTPLFNAFGNAGGAFDVPAPLVFYSRRIGQAPPQTSNVAPLDEPTATPVLGAVKVGGAIGQGWKLVLLDAVTGSTTSPSTLFTGSRSVQTAPIANYAAGRLLRTTDGGGLGLVGTAVVRNVSAPTSADNFVSSQSVVGGIDGYKFFDRAQSWVIDGQISASHLGWTPPVSAPTSATTNRSSTASALFSGMTIGTVAKGGVPGPPSTVPGHGPPSTTPGNGPPSIVPGNGPPFTIPGQGSISPPTSPGASGGTPAATVVGSAGAPVNQNTGPNRVLDLAAGQLNGWSGNLNIHRNNGALRVNADAWAISPGFEINDLGFLSRSDIQGLQGQVTWSKFDPDAFTRYRSIGVSKGWTHTFAGEKQSDTINIWSSATFLNYWSANVGTALRREASMPR